MPWSGTLGCVLGVLGVLAGSAAFVPAADDKTNGKATEYLGRIVAARQVRVTPSMAGHIVELLVDVGRHAKQGEILARLDDRRAKIALMVAQAKLVHAHAACAEVKAEPAKEEVAQAEAELQKTKALYTLAQRDKERALELARKVAISKEEVDQRISKERELLATLKKAQAALDRLKLGPRKERLAVAEAEIKQAQAGLLAAQERLESTVVRAPIDGTVLMTHIQAGDFLNPRGLTRSAVCDLADLSRLEVVIDVPERDLAQVSRDQSCRIELTSMPKAQLEGKVANVAPFVDPKTGTAKVRVALDVGKSEGKILPGMSARVKILVKE
jgi:HlyD family secretion protein